MKTPFNLTTLVGLLLGMVCNATVADDVKYFEPPMVLIPSGSFYMGSDRGAPDEKPVREVQISTFQIGKYEVTFAEFKKFADATNFKMENTCYQYVLGGPHRKKFGTWDDNIYRLGEYHPVVCISLNAAKQYTNWLSEQTGKKYRLPTEAEWEYTARAGTHTRFHFGTERDASKACEYGNVSDWYAADKSAELFEGANVVEIEKCSDNEATLSMVGLYQPNHYGVYDMLGNVNEYVQDCYSKSYEGAPLDGSAVLVDDCKEIVVRGGSWHWFPYASSQRYALPVDANIGALEGFRLALDVSDGEVSASTGTNAFVRDLEQAQRETIAQHKRKPKYPSSPEGLTVLASNAKHIKLRWQKNIEPWANHYKVYRQDPLNNVTVAISTKLSDTEFTDASPLSHNAIYHVVALNGETESQPSNKVDSKFETLHKLPTLVQGEAYTYADAPNVHLSGLEPADDRVIVSLFDRHAIYIVESPKDETYEIQARVFHSGGEQDLKFWIGDRLIFSKHISGDRGWKTLTDIKFSLPQGKSELRVKGVNDLFAINWLNFQKTSAKQ